MKSVKTDAIGTFPQVTRRITWDCLTQLFAKLKTHSIHEDILCWEIPNSAFLKFTKLTTLSLKAYITNSKNKVNKESQV